MYAVLVCVGVYGVVSIFVDVYDSVFVWACMIVSFFLDGLESFLKSTPAN